MRIKKGDKIKVIAGKDKGKIGKVLQVFPEKDKVSVEGVNLLIKHLRPNKQGEKGQRVEFSAPMSATNLMVVCGKCKKATRISYEIINNKSDKENSVKAVKKKFRVCKKCKERF